MQKAPQSILELENRAKNLAGLTIYELADILQESVPQNLLKAKGWLGQAVERYLGATSGCKPQPDFLNLSVELKTLPLNKNYWSQETTYVCRVPSQEKTLGTSFRSSRVFDKIKKVLWVPYEADPKISIGMRKIAAPLLWELSKDEEAILSQDYEELMEIISLSGLSSITAHHGTYLQIRPKAAHSRIKHQTLTADGDFVFTVPRGFYLRTAFTNLILRKNYILR